MKYRAILLFIATFALLTSTVSSIGLAQDDIKQFQIRNLTRNLGYGAAIHNFKNYVLRGKDKYRHAASLHFNAAEAAISSLQGAELSIDERVALNGIKKMINEYQAGLLVAQQQLESGKKFSEAIIETDKLVKVDDTTAINGIVIFRKEYQWNDLETLEYALGYGGAIHNFKNYLLRGTDKYGLNAGSRFDEAANIIAKINTVPGLSNAEKAALTDISRMIKNYQRSLSKIKATVSHIQKTNRDRIKSLMITSSDKMVKVDDGPAIAALAVLARRY